MKSYQQFAVSAILAIMSTVVMSQAESPSDDPLPPTHADIPFGTHERQQMDIWLADSVTPTPLLISIHGGGFVQGSYKRAPRKRIESFMEAGISVASIGYRFVRQEKLPAAHEDVVRAVQFLRHHADTYNLDSTRFAATGGSAGAQLSLYLALHDDAADPESSDPIRRQSSRILAAGVSGAQTSMDLDWWIRNIPGYTEYHMPTSFYFGEVEEPELARIISDISALELASADDVPVYLQYRMHPDQPISEVPADRLRGWQIHHSKFGVALKKRMEELGLEVILSHPDDGGNVYGSVDTFLKTKLGKLPVE